MKRPVPIALPTLTALTALTAISCCQRAPAQLRLSSASGGGERQPIVNEGGTVVAYGALVGGVRELFTVGVDGGLPQQRTTGAGLYFDFGTFGNWPSLSISADGSKITYWSQAGVVVFDTTTNVAKPLAPSYSSAFPKIDPSGTTVVYQVGVGSYFEVHSVPASGGPSRQLSSNSGGGNRHPDIHGNLVLYQAVVGGNQELFTCDLTTLVRKQITTGSGGGNRYGKFGSGGKAVVYEAVVGSALEVHSVDPLIGIPSIAQLTSTGSGGARLPFLTRDGQVYYQAVASTTAGLEVFTTTQAAPLTAAGGPVNRRPSADAHGHVVVYQAVYGSDLEVWRIRMCPTPRFTPYGVHGTPSVGALTSAPDVFQCALIAALQTALGPNVQCWIALGATSFPTGLPLPGAPGNFVYVSPDVALPVATNGAGALVTSFALPPGLAGTLYYQWVLQDPPANPLGFVLSQGMRVDL